MELQEWVRTDGEESIFSDLLSASRMTIKRTTGVTLADVEGDPEATALYKLVQKMIVADAYENRLGSNNNLLLIGYSSQLSSYKLVNEPYKAVVKI
jgi:hypothetical protein